MRKQTGVFVALFVSVAFSVAAEDCPPDSWCCQSTNDRTILNIPDYGDVCGGYGNGCTECADTGTGDSCVTNGTYCSPRHPQHRVAP